MSAPEADRLLGIVHASAGKGDLDTDFLLFLFPGEEQATGTGTKGGGGGGSDEAAAADDDEYTVDDDDDNDDSNDPKFATLAAWHSAEAAPRKQRTLRQLRQKLARSATSPRSGEEDGEASAGATGLTPGVDGDGNGDVSAEELILALKRALEARAAQCSRWNIASVNLHGNDAALMAKLLGVGDDVAAADALLVGICADAGASAGVQMQYVCLCFRL